MSRSTSVLSAPVFLRHTVKVHALCGIHGQSHPTQGNARTRDFVHHHGQLIFLGNQGLNKTPVTRVFLRLNFHAQCVGRTEYRSEERRVGKECRSRWWT